MVVSVQEVPLYFFELGTAAGDMQRRGVEPSRVEARLAIAVIIIDFCGLRLVFAMCAVGRRVGLF